MVDSKVAQEPAAGVRADHRAATARNRTVPFDWGALAGMIVAGFVVRLIVAHQPLFADELSTYWISATHSLGGVMSLMYGNHHIQHAEITPPLVFVATWIAAQVSHAPEVLRAPSLIAGTLTIPLIFAVGRRTLGQRAGLLAAALTSFSTFMIYYSAEDRSYALMMFLVTLSTYALLRGLDEPAARRWWVLFAVSNALAFFTHYTCFFVLAAQVVWALWAHPQTRRPVLISTAGAAVLLIPWAPGLINDLRSPTTTILSQLSPFTAHEVRLSIQHWALGYPYTVGGGLADLPGVPALVMLGGAALAVLAGVAGYARRHGARELFSRLRPAHVLLIALLLATPLGEALVSAVSTHLFGVRNLAASWPALALVCSAAIVWSGRRLGVLAATLTIVAFALGAVKMLSSRWSRPDFVTAAHLVQRSARLGDVIIDGTGILSPGPLTGLDVVLPHPRGPEFRAGAPQERDHPFDFADKIQSFGTAATRATQAARGGRIFVVIYPSTPVSGLAPAYRLVSTRRLPDFIPAPVPNGPRFLLVETWAKANASG